MKRLILLVAVVAVTAASAAVVASTPAEGVLSPARSSLSWEGGPLTGVSAASCDPSACDDFTLTIDVPSSYWKRSPGGVAIRLDWQDANDEIDLHVYDPNGKEVGNSIELHTNDEQAFIFAPVRGTYRVHVDGFQVTNAAYRGRAWIARADDPIARSSSARMSFAPPAFVDPQLWVAMPSIWAARDGVTYVAGPWGLTTLGTVVWRSLDGGRTFRSASPPLAAGVADPRMRPCPASLGGGDADIVTDRTGRAYFLDLYLAGVTVGVSTDRGATWRCNTVAATSPEDDRPWLAPAPLADGEGPNIDAYLVYRDFGTTGLIPVVGEIAKPVSLHLDVTRDGGATWTQRTTFARNGVGYTGPLFTAPDGTLYQVYQNRASVMIARSTDKGRTMRLIRVADRYASPANQWLGGDVDAAGNVYVAWVDQGTWDVMLSRSRDHGVTWSKPLRINHPASETAAMPWVAAGRAGDVAVAWYGSDGTFAPGTAPTTARWYPWVARSVNATSASPSFSRTRLSPTPMRFGPLCLIGIGCADRRVGDFFEIDIGPDGALMASYADTGRIQATTDGASPGPYVMVSRQLSGLGMARTAPLAFERAGDVNESEMGETAPLDLTGLPRPAWTKSTMRISVPVSSALDLAATLRGGIASEAYWLILWKARDRVEYAGLRIDRNGALSFFGGDQPVGVARPEPTAPQQKVEKLATYPATFSLTGRIDEATNQIVIDVPYALYGLRPGDTLYSMQAFTMAGLAQSLRSYQPLIVVDSTPARSIRIG
ncbi:MAG: hypothetical protein WAT66_15770 [Actinomycetota bacterium]